MIMSYSNRLGFSTLSKYGKCLILFLLLFISFSQGRNQPIGALFPASDVFKWDGCEDVKPSDFKEVKLVTFGGHKLRQPTEICFNKISDVPNFYFTEKISGRIAYYIDATKEVQEVGSVKHELLTKGWEDGLNGIALDYDFDTNRWMYLFYSVKGFYRIARFKITPENTMDMSSQQNILDVPKNDGRWHASGSMDFDVYGDLWIAVGDNLHGYYNNTDYVSMATAELLGSWLRIHPTAEKQSDGKYYTIPKDNFGEYWAKKFEEEGRTALAKDYRDPSVVFPEIFAKGVRNSWGLKVVEPFRRFVASGECGPDHPKPEHFSEETNITNTPKFFGWPIHSGAGPTRPYKGKQLSGIPGGTVYDTLAPGIGTNKNIPGAKVLPPIQSAVYRWEYRNNASKSKTRSCGTGSEMYWYDGYSKSERKFPPHFNGKLFATDHDAQWIRIVTLNDAMDQTLSESEFFAPNSQINTEKPLDLRFGPDGALYVIHWIGEWFNDNPKQNISRIEYTGTCKPAVPKSPFRGCMDPKAGNYDPRVKYGCPNNECCTAPVVKMPDEKKLFNIGNHEAGLAVNIINQGSHSLKVFNVNGKLVASEAGKGAKQYHFSSLELGLYFITLEIDNRKFSRRVPVNFAPYL